MATSKIIHKTEEDLQQAILKAKARGMPDVQIGQKYGVTFHYIEKVITKSKGIAVSSFRESKKIKTLVPKDFKEETTTVWSFRQRGKWATHSGEYRGNWSPYIPRNIILKYSKPGELVLDYFCGAGTTAVEAKLLGRRCIGIDINDKAIKLAYQNIDFKVDTSQLTLSDDQFPPNIYGPQLLVGDARNLSNIENDSIDLICAHPPYSDIIHYTDCKAGDLSFYDIDNFLREMVKVAAESYRVLKPGRQCAILIGDMRRQKHVVPLGFELINIYLDVGFKLRELIIKRQHNCKTTGFWYANSIKYNFLLLAHEYLPVFEKPRSKIGPSLGEKLVDFEWMVPTITKARPKKKLKEYETTTVWVLPNKDFDKLLTKNVIERYSNETDYSIITFVSPSENSNLVAKDKSQLLFIRSPFLNGYPSIMEIEYYLQKIKGIIITELPKVTAGGFVIVQTQDVRVDGFVEPLAKRMLDSLKFDALEIKEIIVAIPEAKATPKNFGESNDYLRINHQYLLVYEVKG